MSIREMMKIIAASALFFMGLGAGVVFLLGKFLPAYYRSVFRNGHEAGFDPVAVGLGQGLTQGVAAGAVVGLLLIAVLAWYRAQTFTGHR